MLALVLCCAGGTSVLVCAIRVSFFAFFSWGNKWMKERRKKKLFLWRKWNYLDISSIASRLKEHLIHTQNTKFIKTTKNFTIEQHAFILISFSLFSFPFETFHLKDFSFTITEIFPPQKPSSRLKFPLLNIFSFFLQLRNTFAIYRPKVPNVYKRLKRKLFLNGQKHWEECERARHAQCFVNVFRFSKIWPKSIRVIEGLRDQKLLF